MIYDKDEKPFSDSLKEILSLCLGRILYGFCMTTGVILALRVASIMP